MAVDTRNKRSAAVHVGVPGRGQFPTPDTSISIYDRAHAGGYYRLAQIANPAWYYYLHLLAGIGY